MAFGLGKLAVLESKLNIYEDLSQQMLDKLEKAVGTISENSNKIAIIHDRIDRIQKKVDANQRFVVGAGAVLATLTVVAQVAFPIYKTLTPRVSAASMDAVEMPVVLSELS